jgi:hypothetical protein
MENNITIKIEGVPAVLKHHVYYNGHDYYFAKIIGEKKIAMLDEHFKLIIYLY